jgi:soluble lytic murein transglycosylase-like protein
MHFSKLELLCPKVKVLFKTGVVLAALLTVLGWQVRTIAPTASAETSIPASILPSCGNPELDRIILQAGAKYGVDPKLIHYVIRQESNFKNQARSGKDAQGLMQIIPATAERFHVDDPYDPKQNVEGGTRYLRWLLKEFDGNVNLALAGYNAGEGAVRRSGYQVPDYKETQTYVSKIVSAYGKHYHPVLEPEQAREEFGLPVPDIQ